MIFGQYYYQWYCSGSDSCTGGIDDISGGISGSNGSGGDNDSSGDSSCYISNITNIISSRVCGNVIDMIYKCST